MANTAVKANSTAITTTIDIYTDGSALRNSKSSPAGWACYWPTLGILRSGSMVGTNNIAELRAIDYSLWFTINRLEPVSSSTIIIHSDSEYSIAVITGLKRAHVNLSLIEKIKRFIEELKEKKVRVEFKHVAAHTGGDDEASQYNDIVDKEARRMTSSANIKRSAANDHNASVEHSANDEH